MPIPVFDLGNVLIRWDPRNLYRKLFADPKQMEWFLSHVCTPEWNEQQDAGRPFSMAIADLTSRFPDHKDMIQAYFDRWPEMLNGPIEENVAIFAEIRQRAIPVYALSNWSTETFPVAQKRFDFLSWFDGIVLSGKEKLIKPDPRLYEILLKRYKLKATDIVFIDDSQKNIDAAKRLGMTTIHFTPATDLRSLLMPLLD